MKTLLKYLKPHLPIVLTCVLCKTVAAFTDLIIPRLLAVIIDEDIPTGDIDRVVRTGSFMLLFALLTLLFNITGNRLSARVVAAFSKDLRHDLFVTTVRLDSAAADRIGLSSLTSRLTSDTYNVSVFLGRLHRMGLRAPMILIGGIIITFTLDYRLALIFLLVLPLVFATVFIITKKSIPIYKEQQRTLDNLVRRVDETSSGIRVIKALSKVGYEKERFDETSGKLADQEIKAGRLTSLTSPVNDLIFYSGFCFVVIVGAMIAASGDVEISGTLLAFMTYFTMVLNSMIAMSRIFVQMSRAAASAARLEEVLLTESELALTDTSPAKDEPYIVFDNVSFSYNKRVNNIDSVSFTLERGETLGIIGATGSGKTTLIKLLLRLYDVDSGAIRIGGRDLRSIPREELYSLFGVAFQSDFIMKGSIRDNVSFYRGISDEAISAATKTAQAESFISELETGLDHGIATGGANVSGGQKQRLLISRAVADSPEILILDDSTSALDYKTDKELRHAIKRDVRSTAVIVSQRVASVKDADKILVLDKGRLIGVGRHDELLDTVPEYREIARVQMEVN